MRYICQNFDGKNLLAWPGGRIQRLQRGRLPRRRCPHRPLPRLLFSKQHLDHPRTSRLHPGFTGPGGDQRIPLLVGGANIQNSAVNAAPISNAASGAGAWSAAQVPLRCQAALSWLATVFSVPEQLLTAPRGAPARCAASSWRYPDMIPFVRRDPKFGPLSIGPLSIAVLHCLFHS